MVKSSMRYMAIAAGVFALVPSVGHAFSGNLVTCHPTIGNTTLTTFKPGVTCTPTFNKITVKATVKGGNPVDNCTANPAAPWAAWQTGKYQKAGLADALSIAKADVVIAGITYGTCNFAGDPNAFGANAGGSFQFYNSGGGKVNGGSGAWYGKISGDLTTSSAQAVAIITKGFAVGANYLTQVAIDLSGPDNGSFLACNLGSLCPPDNFLPKGAASCTGPAAPNACCTAKGVGATCLAPLTKLDLINPPGPLPAPSVFSIDLVDNSLCTAPSNPWKCCTGPTTGNCGLFY